MPLCARRRPRRSGRGELYAGGIEFPAFRSSSGIARRDRAPGSPGSSEPILPWLRWPAYHARNWIVRARRPVRTSRRHVAAVKPSTHFWGKSRGRAASIQSSMKSHRLLDSRERCRANGNDEVPILAPVTALAMFLANYHVVPATMRDSCCPRLTATVSCGSIALNGLAACCNSHKRTCFQ